MVRLSLRGALVFLTRVPIRLEGPPVLSRTVPWLPIAGGVIGAAVGGVAAGALHVMPPLPAAALAVAVGLLVTGAFHEDGLADVADAFGGGWTTGQRLEILRDPRHGTYGVAALCSSIVVRVGAVAALGPASAFGALVAAHALARGAAAGVMVVAPVARDSGLAAQQADGLHWAAAWAGIAGGVAIATVATGWWVGPMTAAVTLGAVATGVLALRKIRGINGDVLGAVEQVAECAALLVASGLAARYAPWWA